MVRCGVGLSRTFEPRVPVDVEMQVCPFVVVQDTSEQLPWQFRNIVYQKKLWLVKRERQSLDTGDYSIQGYESLFTIERKSGSDLIGTITYGNKRFRAEHERMVAMQRLGGWACVVIEDSYASVCQQMDAANHPRIRSEMLKGIVSTWPMRYGVPWFFAEDRPHAEELGLYLMIKWRELHMEKLQANASNPLPPEIAVH